MQHNEKSMILSISECPYYLVAKGDLYDAEPIKNTEGKPRRFNSLYAAKCWWKEQGAGQVWMVNESPYDEMIGNQGPIRDAMALNSTPDAA